MKIACFGNMQYGLVQSIYLKIKHEAFSDTALFDVGHELDNVIDAVRKANSKAHFDVAVSLGGDGTMVAVARECSYYSFFNFYSRVSELLS